MQVCFQGLLLKATLRDETHLIRAQLELQLPGSQRADSSASSGSASLFYQGLSSGFPGGTDGKESAYNMGDTGSVSGSGRPPRGANGNPLQYFCLESPHGSLGRSLGGYSLWGPELDTTEHIANARMSSGRRGASWGSLLHMV